MRPQLSVLFLTTLIGAGQGLFIALFAVEVGEWLGLLPSPHRPWFYVTGSFLAFVVTAAGLVASFFHLGVPSRAWRSAARWRTSWLSREVIVLPGFLGLALLNAVAHFAHWDAAWVTLAPGLAIDATLAIGFVGTLAALALFVCTAMIYACLPFVREWHTPLTVLNYALLGGASGFTLAAAYASGVAPALVPFLASVALALTIGGAAGRVATLARNARLKPKSTLQTAIGVKHPRIRQTSPGFTGGSFNTQEFFHGQSASRVVSIQWLFVVAAFVLPAALLALGILARTHGALAVAFAIQYAGLIAERWHFFAQVEHPQNLYYQARG